jgi:purine nucleosidase
MRRVIIDTDGNLEALKAIELVVGAEDVELVAITTEASSLSISQATSNVLNKLKNLKCNVPVYKGASMPISKAPNEIKLDKHEIYGDEILETKESLNAVDVLINNCEDVEIISMGPLTNLALALSKSRDKFLKVKKITILGGTVFYGDVSLMSEYNFYYDAVAADAVLKSGIDLMILPIDVGDYSTRMKLALYPELIKKKYESYTRVEVDGDITYGASINDVRDRNREEFVSQSNVMHPFNCVLVLDNAEEEISMEV